jgi:MFS family permease
VTAQTAARHGGDTTADRFDRRLLPPMMLGSVLNPINSSIIAVSLVPIGAAFGAPPSQTAWLVSALYLATSIGQPVVGRLIDLYGPRRLFLTGTALAGVAGVLGVLAPNLGVLVAARVVLGFGTCAGYPAAMYLIRSEAARTGHKSPTGVLTALAVTTQTISVIGPSLGGLLISIGGWRATFAVNIPLALAGLYLGARRLPATPGRAEAADGGAAPDRRAADGRADADGHAAAGRADAARRAADGRARAGSRLRIRVPAGLDLPGMALFAATLVTLLLFLMDPRLSHGYLLLLTAAAGAGFWIRELRVSTQPFIDLRVLAGNRPLVTTYVRALLAYVVSYAYLYGYTQWMEDGRGLSASQAGLAQLPLFAVAIAISTTTGRRPEIRRKLLVGSAFQVVACAMLLLLGGHSPVWLLIAVAVVFGVPQGLNSLALQNSVYFQADPERIGSSAGLLRTFGYLGAIVASAASGAFFTDRADTGGLHHLAWFLVVVAAGFLAVTAADRSLSRVRTEES